MTDFAIIIPVHNRRETTLACLRHLQTDSSRPDLNCIIVDDGSTDGTAAAVQDGFPRVTILHGDGNLWWTGAIALGSAHAFARGAHAVVWLNDDCLPDQGSIGRLLDFVSAHPDSIAAPAAMDARDGSPVPTGFIGRKAVSPGGPDRLLVEGLSGYCLAVPRQVWTRLGPPDSRRFPHYFGDTAYTLMATRRGIRVTLLPEARVRLTDCHPEPRSPAGLRFPRSARRTEYHAVFLAVKSRFRLATHWHYLRLKYGPVTGSILAIGRMMVWHVQFLLGRSAKSAP